MRLYRRLLFASPVAFAVIGCGGSVEPSPAAEETPPEVATPSDAEIARARAVLERSVSVASPFEDLVSIARDLAVLPFTPDDEMAESALGDLTYEEYRAIEYRAEAALWRGLAPFEVQLFHPGFLYSTPVRIHVLEDGESALVPFDSERFEYGEASAHVPGMIDSNGRSPGYAGFRIHYPMHDEASKDEVAVFLGASYFRLLGPGHGHGLSSRGVAVNVAEEGGEEFPTFRAFWLVRPAPDDEAVTFFGLLDGPSLTGAYRFELRPGSVAGESEEAATHLDVDARLFARADVTKLGIAPLTSMFLFGENDDEGYDDFRPEVHDSDGLLMQTSWGEWIWRPLSNRPVIQVSSLRDEQPPEGFGLAQRDRSFDHYLDLEARYHERPSEWVALADGDWGSGGVELVEIPTPSEFNDNIVASWVPDEPFRTGDAREYRYRLETFDDRHPTQSLAQVERTRIGGDALPGQAGAAPRSRRRFVVDFVGGELGALTADDSIGALLVASTGAASEPVVQPLPSEGYRATFTLEPAGDAPADLRLFLEVPGRRVTETWSYLHVPLDD